MKHYVNLGAEEDTYNVSEWLWCWNSRVIRECVEGFVRNRVEI